MVQVGYSWSGKDGQNNTVTGNGAVEVQSDTQATKVGASFKSGENLPPSVQTIATHRHFFQSNDWGASKTWANEPNLVKAYNQYGCRVFNMSFKPTGGSTGTVPFSTTVQQRIGAFLDSIPASVSRQDVLLTYYHEHDGNIRDGSLTIANYRAGSQVIADLAHARGMRYGPIHNGMVYDASRTPRWGLYSNIWAANEADLSLYDFWGADCYSDNYEDPSPRMDALKTYADSLGLPLLIGEMASPIDNPTAQATWATKARTWALDNTKWAHWWSSQVDPESSNTNYRMTDQSARNWFGI